MKQNRLFLISVLLLLTSCQGLTLFPRPHDYRIDILTGSTQKGFKDGSANEAEFDEPSDLAVNSNNDVFIADKGNQAIRKLSNGQVVTLLSNRDTEHELSLSKISVDQNIVYFNDSTQQCWFKMTNKNNLSKVYCGSKEDRTSGFLIVGDLFIHENQVVVYNSVLGGSYIIKEDQSQQKISITNSKFTDNQDNRYHADTNVIKVLPGGQEVDIGKSYEPHQGIESINNGCSSFKETCPVRGHVDGPPDKAEFNRPGAIVIGKDDTVYVSDTGNKKIRTIDQKMNVGTLPLNFEHAIEDMELDNNGDIIAIHGNQIIKIVTPK